VGEMAHSQEKLKLFGLQKVPFGKVGKSFRKPRRLPKQVESIETP